PLFAIGASGVSQFAINLAFMLHVALGPKATPEVHAVEWFQWNAMAAAAFGLLWLVLRRWGAISGQSKLASKVLSDLQLVVAGAASLALVLWSGGMIFLDPFAAAPELRTLG